MQVFGFLLGIDLKGMSAGAGGDEKDGQDQMRDIPTPPQATPQAQAEAKPAEKEQEEENEVTCRRFVVGLVIHSWFVVC